MNEDEANAAIKLWQNGEKDTAINMLTKLSNKYPNDFKLNLILGLYLTNNKKHIKAIYYLKKAYEISDKPENLTLSLYISYADIERYDKAFEVLFRYLNKYPANMLKDTLEELLEGLMEGYGTNYKDEIIYFSKKNNVSIPTELL